MVQVMAGDRSGGTTTIKRISRTAHSGRIPVTLPPLPEQSAIAAVLSDMDAELAALETRCEKTHALKQGMMQGVADRKDTAGMSGGTQYFRIMLGAKSVYAKQCYAEQWFGGGWNIRARFGPPI